MVRMKSEGEIQGDTEDECVDVSTGEDLAVLQWLQISINGVILYGKFSEMAVIDNRIKVAEYRYNRETKLVDIIIPHFWATAEFDPDFQVLFSKEEADACTGNIKSDKFTSGVIAGITVGVVVGTALIIATAMFLVLKSRKRKTLQRLRGRNSVKMAPTNSVYSSSDSASSNAGGGMASPSSTSPLFNNNEKENPLFTADN